MASSSQLNCKNIIDQYYDNLQDDPQQIEGVLKFLKVVLLELLKIMVTTAKAQ